MMKIINFKTITINLQSVNCFACSKNVTTPDPWVQMAKQSVCQEKTMNRNRERHKGCHELL